MKRVSKSLAETEEAAKDFLDFLSENKVGKGAQVAGLFGDLGAGKTTFVQAIGRLVGIKEIITSPTFVIMKRYEVEAPGTSHFRDHSGAFAQVLVSKMAGSDRPTSSFERLIHIDAYRLKNGEELMKLNFAEVLADPNNLVLIEWPENVASAMPENFHKVYFKFIDENTREIEYSSAKHTTLK